MCPHLEVSQKHIKTGPVSFGYTSAGVRPAEAPCPYIGPFSHGISLSLLMCPLPVFRLAGSVMCSERASALVHSAKSSVFLLKTLSS